MPVGLEALMSPFAIKLPLSQAAHIVVKDGGYHIEVMRFLSPMKARAWRRRELHLSEQPERHVAAGPRDFKSISHGRVFSNGEQGDHA